MMNNGGMFIYDKICSVGVKVIINGRINPLSAVCDKIEYGEPKIIPMGDKEKLKY